MQFGRCLVLALCACATPVFAQSETPADLARVEQVTKCMLNVLKTVTGVSDPRRGITVGIPGQVLPPPGRVPRPYVEYRADEEARWTTPTRFIYESSNKSAIFFQTVLPGMVSAGTTPDTHVTDIVIKRWKARCGVQTSVLFE